MQISNDVIGFKKYVPFVSWHVLRRDQISSIANDRDRTE